MTEQYVLQIIDNQIVLTSSNITVQPFAVSGDNFFTATLLESGELKIVHKNSVAVFENVKYGGVIPPSDLICIKHKKRILIFGSSVIRSAVLFKISSNETSRERFRAILETFNKPFVDLPQNQDCVFVTLRNNRCTMIYGSPEDMTKFHRVANQSINFNETSIPVFCGEKKQ